MVGLRSLELIFDFGGASPIHVWNAIFTVMNRRGSAPPKAKLGSKIVPTESLERRLQEAEVNHFNIQTDLFSFDFGAVGSACHDVLEIREVAPDSLGDCDDWISAFAARFSLIQAWVSDVNYAYWQNAQDPLQYEAAGRSLAGLPMISNGLPPPLEQDEVDISGNPARRVIRSGYVEAIGGTMWLAPAFFERVKGASIDRLRSKEWVSVVDQGGIWKIAVGSGIFRDSGDKILQQEFRDLLYGQSA